MRFRRSTLVSVFLLALTSSAQVVAGPSPEGKRVEDPAPAETPVPQPVYEPPVRLPIRLPTGWYAGIETTHGVIVARLLPEQAPQSVAHFAALAEGRLPWTDPVTGVETTGHYYDGVLVHKAVAGQRFEAGDRLGTGYSAPDFYVPPEGFGPLNFHQGSRLGMTMSRYGGKISGVVFFATAEPQPWLSGKHPCFGEIVVGWDVVWSISKVGTSGDGRPREPVRIDRVRLFKIGDPPPLPEPVPHTPTMRELRPRFREKREPHPE
jgi:peptidyl-prolyl cis-trans isomerase A (cyclophilin A)